MNFLKKLNPVWILRTALGLMYLYSGADLYFHPTAWIWALPYWLREIMARFIDVNSYIAFQGIIEIIMALALLSWFIKPRLVKWVALLFSIEMAGILIFTLIPFSQANFLITFRDVGVLGASLALFVLLLKEDGANEQI